MRLDFNVLWVDDQPGRVHAQIEAIKKKMEAEGFNFFATLCKSIPEVQARIANHVFVDEIDLILVDWDLGQDVTGAAAISAIREPIPYKDVVFYSAMQGAGQLRTAAFEANLEGVYCASRDDLVEEVMGVFESLVKKVLDLDHTRGIVMGATSDIDHMVNQCLVAMHGKLDGAGQEAMLKEALERIKERMDDLTKRAAKVATATTMATLFGAHMIFTANDRLRILTRLLKVDLFKDHAGARGAVQEYMDTVVPGRNDLGHVVLVPQGKPQAVVTVEGKQISLEQARELRRLILRLRQDFRGLLTALQAADAGTGTAAPLASGAQ